MPDARGAAPDPSDSFTAGAQRAPTDCRTTTRRWGQVTPEHMAWIMERTPCLRVHETQALVERVREVEAALDLALEVMCMPCYEKYLERESE